MERSLPTHEGGRTAFRFLMASSDLVKKHFADHARDLTPISAGKTACVLYVPVSHDPGISRHCESVLSSAEAHRANRFISQFDRDQFRQRRAFRKFCGAAMLEFSTSLAQIAFKETEKGRPFLADSPETWFSFSSCRLGFLGAWSSTHGIGVDVEDQTKDLEAVELAHQYFSGAEARVVEQGDGQERLLSFFRFWSLKEAGLKSIGEGLPFGLDAFEFELSPNLRLIHAPLEQGGPAHFSAHLIEGTGSCAALVTRNLSLCQ
jgi:phosphopantetheinyl transferase